MATENPYSPTDAAPRDQPSPPAVRSPRLWPALLLVTIYWVAWLIVNVWLPGTFTQFLTLFWTPMLIAAGLLVWWLAFSRLPWRDRLWGPAWLVLGGVLALWFCHKSMQGGLLIYGLPAALSVVVLWVIVTSGAATRAGWLGIAAASLLTWGYFTLLRFDGITGGFTSARSWRWSPTAEDIFLREQRQLAQPQPQGAAAEATVNAAELVASADDWPQFRGPNRDSYVRGVSLQRNWSTHPPRERWRRRVGPGWSSFAVVGNRAFTQEQRGAVEAVVCFDVASGKEIWSHEDPARFEEVVAGAGPRATPTFHQGQLYSLGGSGVLNGLDAATGRLLWKRDIATDANAKPPQWGFASSPLVAQGVVSVFAGGRDGKSVLAYDAETGVPRWAAGKGTHSYSSPQLLRMAAVDQVLMVSNHGLEAFEPATGRLLWDHDWNINDMFRVCQPTVVGPSQVVLGTGMGFGARLLNIAKNGDDWSATEKWTSKDLKPYFNDSVVRDGHLYGFDGAVLTCLDLATGKKKWKKGRYGYGQVLLVGEEGLMLVISEQGEAALTEATPQDLKELARFPALAGKTWNHPVVAANKLLLRNSEEMACYDLDQPSASQ